MSSYLTFYAVPRRKSKDEKKQYIELISYSRSNDIYQLFNDNLQIVWAGNEEKYTSINKSDIDLLYSELNKDIDSATERVELYEKYAHDNRDYIEDIIETRHYIKDLQETKSKLSFLCDIITDAEMLDYSGVEEICCNIV